MSLDDKKSYTEKEWRLMAKEKISNLEAENLQLREALQKEFCVCVDNISLIPGDHPFSCDYRDFFLSQRLEKDTISVKLP